MQTKSKQRALPKPREPKLVKVQENKEEKKPPKKSATPPVQDVAIKQLPKIPKLSRSDSDEYLIKERIIQSTAQ